jgi:hypothetical protein
MTGYGAGPSEAREGDEIQGSPSSLPTPPEQWGPPTQPWQAGASEPFNVIESAPTTPPSWMRWAIPAAALAVGLSVGGAIGVGVAVASSDPTRAEEYQALQQDLEDAEGRVLNLSSTAREAASASRQAPEEAAQRRAELDQREQAVAAREQAVTVVEQQVAANSIGEGTWTVGVDIEPGTYRTAEAVTQQCYWGIYRSGSNGSDIIDNDIVNGGFPTVQLSEGQDFENNRCGTFVKQ